ncbi:RecQ family ATP-dependent DNA helicase [Chryseobacterium sp. A301]
MNDARYQQLKYEYLKMFWGYSEFRDQQEEIIDSIVSGKDTLALLPTGAGKSLCYQLPALFLEGTCLIISPLLALMRDQVIQLKALGIEAEYLSFELEDLEMELILSRCKEGVTKLLFVSPERLQNSVFLRHMEEIEVSFLAVDEAHCISEWGQDFRPSYQHIKQFREEFLQVPCLALTATATPQVLAEIKTKLALTPVQLFQKSFKRDNLQIAMEKESHKYERVAELLRNHKESGLIYVRTRKEAENLSQFLRSRGNDRVQYYHAGLSAKEKISRQTHWLQSSNQVLISTNAFGMGIDKTNVRFVVHFTIPSSLENYYQEIGRAGRDAHLSLALLLWSEEEIAEFDRILKNQMPTKEQYEKILSILYSIYQVAEGELPEKSFVLDIEKIKRLTRCSGAKVRNIIQFLHHQELIYHNDYKSPSTLELFLSPDEIDQLPASEAAVLENLYRQLPGLSKQRVHFSDIGLASKIGVSLENLKQTFVTLNKTDYALYMDGSLSSVKFLKPRDSRALSFGYYPLFAQIQKNKVQKWEEMKYFVKEEKTCKMVLILRYFGESSNEPCQRCYVCKKNQEANFGSSLESELLFALERGPKTLEQLSVHLSLYPKNDILESLILLLDKEEVKMKDFRTYTKA